MSRNTRTIDSTFEKLERANLITPDGKDWLISACDPFHDSDLHLAGYPDVLTASTVTQMIKKQLVITVPTTGDGLVPVGSNWDCQINLFPNAWHQTPMTNVLTVNSTGQIVNTQAITTVFTGGLQVNSGIQGCQMWPKGPGSNALVTQQGLPFGEYTKGNCRVIGMGFEVVNTTAELYKQGQVTAYRMPNVTSDVSAYRVNSTPQLYGQVSGKLYRFPPPDLATATLLYGSRGWLASEGGYVVSRQNGTENPMQQPSYRSRFYTANDLSGLPIAANQTFMSSENGLMSQIGSMTPDIDAPFDISGLYFTGLSYQTTLTVNVRWIVERMPGPAEVDLVVLATPSCTYDPLALELYSRIMQDLPPGVMFKENPFGEWFRSALGKIKDYAPKIGDALSGIVPGANLIGKAVGTVAGYGHQKLTRAAEKKAGAPKPPPLPPRPARKDTKSNAAMLLGKKTKKL